MVAPKNTDENPTGVGQVDVKNINLFNLLCRADRCLVGYSGKTQLIGFGGGGLLPDLTRPLINANADDNLSEASRQQVIALLKCTREYLKNSQEQIIPPEFEDKDVNILPISIDDRVNAVKNLFSNFAKVCTGEEVDSFSGGKMKDNKEMLQTWVYNESKMITADDSYLGQLIDKVIDSEKYEDVKDQFTEILESARILKLAPEKCLSKKRKDGLKSLGFDEFLSQCEPKISEKSTHSELSEISEKSMHSELWRNYRLLHHQGSNDEHVKLAKKRLKACLKVLAQPPHIRMLWIIICKPHNYASSKRGQSL